MGFGRPLVISSFLITRTSDTADQVAFVAALAFLAEERFESLDHFGDRHRFEACDLGRRCSVHGSFSNRKLISSL